MREIKFRAWSKDEKEMRQVLQITFGDTHMVMAGRCERIVQSIDYVLMQFTGRYDKNGKEIYEGDVVTARNEKWAIQYHADSMGFLLTKDPEDKDAASLRFGRTPASRARAKIEVVGNIYENPELLNN